MAERINKGVRSAEEAERHARVLQEIEAHIEGMEDVSAVLPVSTHACVRICGHLMAAVCLHPSRFASVSSAMSVSGHLSHGLMTQH